MGDQRQVMLCVAKTWITHGPDADTLVAYAKTDPDAGALGCQRRLGLDLAQYQRAIGGELVDACPVKPKLGQDLG